jgi:hypothetical protein
MWNFFQESPNVWLDETNQRLEVRSTADVNEYRSAYLANGWGFSTADNFSFKTDFHNNSTLRPPYFFASVTLGLFKDWSNILIIQADYEVDEYADSYFHYELTIADSNVDAKDKERNTDDGTLYISYDASKDELYLSDTGYWATNAWVTIPGLLKGEWGNHVVVPFLAGSAENGVLASGDAYLDNFVVDSGTIVQICEYALASDLNNDCKVDFRDFAVFASAWLSQPEQPNWNPACDISYPQDDVIDWGDLKFLAQTWFTAFPIANTSGREMSASAAFDGTNFLVGIQGDATADQSITAQFVSKTGTLVGSRILLGTTGGAPAVAFDGTNYLLAWEEDAEAHTFISGQFVSTSGALVGSQFTIATGFTDIQGEGKYIIFDGTNYFVAWENRWSSEWGTSNLFGQFITPSGAKLGSVISISTAAYGQRELSIAFDGANILAVWVDGRNLRACYTDSNGTYCFESDVYGQFITKSSASAAGTLSGSNFLIDAGTLPRDNPTGIGFDGTNYLVTFIEQTAFDGPIWEAYGILVTKTGATIGSKFVIGNTATNQKMVPLPTYLGTKYLVTWTDGFGTTSANVKGIYITTSGTSEGSEFTLFSPASSGAVPWLGMVFTGGGVNLAVTDWGIPNMTDPYDVDIYTSADVMSAIITTP